MVAPVAEVSEAVVVAVPDVSDVMLAPPAPLIRSRRNRVLDDSRLSYLVEVDGLRVGHLIVPGADATLCDMVITLGVEYPQGGAPSCRLCKRCAREGKFRVEMGPPR